MNAHSTRRYLSTTQQEQHQYEYDGVNRQAPKSTSPPTQSDEPALQEFSLLRIIFDGFSIALVFSTWLLFKYAIKPVRRAFLCSDLSLYHQKPPRNVFPTWLLFICAVAIPFVIIIISEGIRWFYIFRNQKLRVVYKIRICSTVYRIPEWIGNLYIILGSFVFAHGVNSFLTNVGKVSVGRLRPHFIPSCFHQNYFKDFCSDATQWIINYTCIGETSSTFKEKDGAYDIRQSFPSGHASTAFCGLIFLALYVHKVWSYRNMGFFPYIVQMCSFALAAYIGITRITDNRHHPTDVLAGAILGSFIATIAFRCMTSSFKQSVLINPENSNAIG